MISPIELRQNPVNVSKPLSIRFLVYLPAPVQLFDTAPGQNNGHKVETDLQKDPYGSKVVNTGKLFHDGRDPKKKRGPHKQQSHAPD
jgi:hypothetical protein